MRPVILILSTLLLTFAPVIAQEPVPTLVPPTPLAVSPQPEPDALLTESRVARIQHDGVVRVGVLYNEPPFAQFTVRGDVIGYEPDLARLMAEAWGVEVELIQVTRRNRFDKLAADDVDILMASVVHRREYDSRFEFSQPYRVGEQVIMVTADSPIATIFNLGGQPVGYVRGTEGETALGAWINSSGVAVQPRPYLTYDDMLAALFGGEVIAIAGRDSHLLRVATTVLDAVEMLPTSLQEEPFAVVLPRQDYHLRQLINRTLQYLASDAALNADSSLETLLREYFPNDDFPVDALTVYRNVGVDAPQPAQFPTDVPLPAQYALPRLTTSGVLRVASIPDPAALPPELARTALANRNVAAALAERWGVRLEYVQGDPLALVESGAVDLALGIAPDWEAAPRVDFSQPYVVHGRRLLYESRLDLAQLGNLRTTNRIIATISGDTGASDLAQAWADSINTNVRFFRASDPEGAVRAILDDNNANVVFGDTLLLLPQLAARSDVLALGPTWYDRSYFVAAIPRNDLDFARLVNYTLQELQASGTLASLTAPLLPPGESPPAIAISPGSSNYAGLQLGG